MLRVFSCFVLLTAAALATELPAPAEERFQQDVAWSPDGQWLAFSEFPGGEFKPEKWAVWVIKADGTGRRQIAQNATYVAWSPDGRRLAYGADHGHGWGLFSTTLDSGVTECYTDLKHKDRQPAWSPDGKKLAFVSDRTGKSNIWLITLGVSDPVQLTNDTLKDYNPQWSADGQQLVFYREKPVGHDDVYVISVSGSGLRAVTADSANDVFPSFHPQGDVVFTSRAAKDGPSLLTRVAADGSRQTISRVSTFFARYSPDGTKVAFISGGWPKSAVYLLNVENSTITKIIN